ncbi:hypothetical protein TL16_g12427 [Triparma laevis f. inornata]|uniref:Uncharacterized protein n=1 Tax=Triparma laevis f. inornata TaxID=1714386 RepID=A0A9W7EWT0_9STRA|nr:hypothetical protein TL16_g12427 [Triparma laevis f. inornata]
MVVTDSFLRSIRGEGVAGLVGVGAGAGVNFDLVEDEEVGVWEGGGIGVGGYESDEGVDVGGDYDDVERLVMSSSSRAISGDMGIASSAIGSALMAAGMIGGAGGLGSFGMGGEEEYVDEINDDMARLGLSSGGGGTTRRKARKKGTTSTGGGKIKSGTNTNTNTTESTLRLRVDGQRHAIKALEKVITDLKKQLGRKKGGGLGRARTLSYEIGRTLRNDLSMTMKQNKTLQGELKKLKEQLKKSKEKEERSREIGLELKRYSNKLRDELECLREELINRGDELDMARKERKKVGKKVGKKKAKQVVEENERREKEAEVRGENISQDDIDRIKKDIKALKEERKNGREVIEVLNREASGLRHRLAVANKTKKKTYRGGGGEGK